MLSFAIAQHTFMNLLINPIDLKILVEANWNLKITQITDAPRGFVAETYFLQTPNSEIFAKIIKAQSRYVDNIESSMYALAEMYQKGFKNTVAPINSIHNKPFYLDQEYMIILFNKINAHSSFTYNKLKYFGLLKQMHSFKPSSFKYSVQKENFKLNFEKELKSNLEMISTDNYMQEQLGIDTDYLNNLSKTFLEFKKVIRSCKRISFKGYITHGDAVGNILEDANQELFLVDWDDLLVAPLERDLWFHDSEKELKEFYPNYKPNSHLFKFYVYRRYFDDISGFLDELYDPENSDEKKSKLIQSFKEDIFNWLEPLVRSLKY